MRQQPKRTGKPANMDDVNAMLDGRADDDGPGFGVFDPAGEIPGIDTPEGCTEAVNAKRFIESHGDDTRYCDSMSKFFHWDGLRWALDQERIIDVKAKGVAERLQRQAADMVKRGGSGLKDAI